MIKQIFFSLSLFILFISAMSVAAQTVDSSKPSVLTGDVVTTAEGKIVLQTKDGPVDVQLTEKTEFKRVPPDNPSLKAAVASTLAEIGVGDRIVVSGVMSADKKSVPARTVFLMTKADISQKLAKDSEQWATRGITGKVVSVNAETNQIVIESRGLAGATSITLTPKANVVFKRYAPNSIKYSEATVGTLTDVKPGDMLRALGDRSTEGTAFAAEEVITGAFQTVAGTVKSVNAATNEVIVTNVQTGKDTTIVVTPSTLLKKFPEEMAQRMAMMQGGPGGAGPGAAGGQGRRRDGAAPAGEGARPAGAERPRRDAAGAEGGQRPEGAGRGGFGGRRNGGIDEMLDRFPTIAPADLKAGDVIAVSSTKSENPDRITAIKLLAGVEPFLRAAQAGGGRNGRGGQGGTGDFNIPGLDGFDGP